MKYKQTALSQDTQSHQHSRLGPCRNYSHIKMFLMKVPQYRLVISQDSTTRFYFSASEDGTVVCPLLSLRTSLKFCWDIELEILLLAAPMADDMLWKYPEAVIPAIIPEVFSFAISLANWMFSAVLL